MRDYCPFVVGQKVVCVNNAFRPMTKFCANNSNSRPKIGEIYVISKIEIVYNQACLVLLEFEPWFGFSASAFRPLVSPGMEILNAILVNTPKDARALDEVGV